MSTYTGGRHLANMACPVRYDRDGAWGRYQCKVVFESDSATASGLRTVVIILPMEKMSLIMCVRSCPRTPGFETGERDLVLQRVLGDTVEINYGKYVIDIATSV